MAEDFSSLYPKCVAAGLEIRRTKEKNGLLYIPFEEFDKKLSKAQVNRLNSFLCGQTCIPQGAYPWDVERFFEGRPVID